MSAALLAFMAVGFLIATVVLTAIACLIVAALPTPKPRPIPPASASLASSKRR